MCRSLRVKNVLAAGILCTVFLCVFPSRFVHPSRADTRTGSSTASITTIVEKCKKVPSLIIFAQYGVFERGRGCVQDINYVNVFQAATGNFSIPHVHVGVGIDMEGSSIDDVFVPEEERRVLIQLMNFSQFEYMKVSYIDEEVDATHCKVQPKLCQSPFWGDWYAEFHIIRAMRAMYCEMRLSALLKGFPSHNDIVVVVMSADILLNRPLDYQDILAAACSENTVYLTRNNDGDVGYTDGFYVGHIKSISTILETFNMLPEHFASGLHAQAYEYLLKATFRSTGTEYKILRGFGLHLHDFIKVRASGDTFGNLQCHAQQLIDSLRCPQLAKTKCFM